jgi:integrase
MKVAATAVTNLVRNAESGTYYARVKHRGKIVWKSLETDVFTTAKTRLPDKVKEIRKTAPLEPGVSASMSFREGVEIYRREVNRMRLKDSSKEFRLRPAGLLKRTWPDLFDMELRRVNADACKTWLHDFENGGSKYAPPRAKKASIAGDSPTSVNSAIAFLRHVFAVGVKAGICSSNPALELEKMKPRKKLLRLPNKTQFAAIVAAIRASNSHGRAAGDLVEGLTYSGARLTEAELLTWGHLDFERGMLTIPGDKTEAAPRTIPMNDSFRTLALRMKAHRGPVQHTDRFFEAKEALSSLKSACAKVGVKKLVHHDLRHLFATTCIESGVDIPTVSNWLGHMDGGALAMRTYGHLRPEHSTEAAKKVKFA